MTKNEILKKIGIIIIELREQYDLTQLNRDDINDIELELFAANSHFLTDHIEILRKLNSREAKPLRQPEPKAAEAKAAEPKYFEPLVKTTIPEKTQPVFDFTEEEQSNTHFAEPTREIAEAAQQEYNPEPELLPAPEPVIIRHEVVLDEPIYKQDNEAEAEETWFNEQAAEIQDEPEEELIDEPIAEIQTELEPENIEPEPYYTPEPVAVEQEPEPFYYTPAPVADEDEKQLTINEILSSQLAAARFNDHSELPPITDIKSAITLNDKLLFVRDLFNGYSMAYGEAIEIINRFSRFEEADQFLKLNYYNKNNWEAKQATADKFYELLQRRFPA